MYVIIVGECVIYQAVLYSLIKRVNMYIKYRTWKGSFNHLSNSRKYVNRASLNKVVIVKLWKVYVKTMCFIFKINRTVFALKECGP